MSIKSSPSRTDCACTDDSFPASTNVSPRCYCPEGELGIVMHQETCVLFKNETFTIPPIVPTKDPCSCPRDKCICKKPDREAFEEWRKNRPIAGALPAVLESNHPLMQKFQETLKRFLEKENALAQTKILDLRDTLKQNKDAYDQDLEKIYRDDHDTNSQRALIQEYEANLTKLTTDRENAEKGAQACQEIYKTAKENLAQEMSAEREATVELEALNNLCQQLKKWREETESEMTINHAMSDKMKKEKKALAEEKREMDIVIFGLNSEIWKLESKLEMFKKQFDIKNKELADVNDKVTVYAAELEDLELDKRRLVSLWNAVLVNIKQRDRVYDSVRDDYKNLQINYRTLITNLDITKKVLRDELNIGKEIAMNKDKLEYDLQNIVKQFDVEDIKRQTYEENVSQMTEAIEMSERDQVLVKLENQHIANLLSATVKEVEKKTEQKLKLENEILVNIQERLLNDKAVESMANGIKKMRDLSRKQEIQLMAMETQHAKVMLDIEIYRSRQAAHNIQLQETLDKVKAREKEVSDLEETYEVNKNMMTRTQRELDILNKKYMNVKEIFEKSSQQARIDELEQQIRTVRERTEHLQREWLRLQGHVVKLTQQHQKLVTDVNLINKQIQICEQKTMRIEAECERVAEERRRVERSLRALRSRLEIMESGRKQAAERNDHVARATLAVTHEYTANLKGAECEILELEEEIENYEKEKNDLSQDLDRVQREALIWQRKGMLAVELKKSVKNAKSAVGEIGQMKTEIHKMEVRREQLIRIAEKLSSDLAHCVVQRENAMEKNRSNAAVAEKQKSCGITSKTQYHHKLRLARVDVARVTKDIEDTTAQIEVLETEQKKLEQEIEETHRENVGLEDQVATLIQECAKSDREKQWLLERVVRCQRLGNELTSVVKRQSLKVRKEKSKALEEFNQGKDLNDRITYVVQTLEREFPYLEEKLASINNTLNIYSPTNSPRLLETDIVDEIIDNSSSTNVAEQPYSDLD